MFFSFVLWETYLHSKSVIEPVSLKVIFFFIELFHFYTLYLETVHFKQLFIWCLTFAFDRMASGKQLFFVLKYRIFQKNVKIHWVVSDTIQRNSWYHEMYFFFFLKKNWFYKSLPALIWGNSGYKTNISTCFYMELVVVDVVNFLQMFKVWSANYNIFLIVYYHF
jgi:hypothetical protein